MSHKVELGYINLLTTINSRIFLFLDSYNLRRTLHISTASACQPVDKEEGDDKISHIIFKIPSYPGCECSQPTALFTSPPHEALTQQRN